MKLKDVLKEMSLADLSNFLGSDLIEGLNSLGVPATKSSLIELLISSRGASFLEDRGKRACFFSSKVVKSLLEISDNEEAKLKTSHWTKIAPDISKLLEIDLDDLLKDANKLEGMIRLDPATGTLFPYQNWMRNNVTSFINNKKGARTLVHMPTGAGKTRTAMHILIDQIRSVSPANFTSIWLAHSDELCEQAVKSFEHIWATQGLSEAKVWRMWGGKSELEAYDGFGCNFVVTSFQTLFSWLKTSNNKKFDRLNKLKKSNNFLIVDEAHLSTATTYRQVIDYISGVSTNIIGLTATPGRHSVGGDEDQTLDLSKFYNNNIIRVTTDAGTPLDNPIEFLQAKKILSEVDEYSLPGTNVELSSDELDYCKTQLELPEGLLRKLGRDEKRTLNIAAKVIELAEIEKKQTIVFCPSKANAELLAEYLKWQDCDAAAITGDLPMSVRSSQIERFKNGTLRVLTNFNVLTTGFDAPNISAVVIARPTLSVVLYSQMIGRGLRGPLFGGTDRTTVVNVQDNLTNLPHFKSAFVYFNQFFK